MKIFGLFLVVVLSHMSSSYAQFGDLLKSAGKELVKTQGKKILSNELHNTKAKFDSTSFSYAISLSDKAAQFESKDKLADVVTVSTLLIDDDKTKSPMDEAREYMDIGEMAYSANGFKLAESSFLAANLIILSENQLADPLYGRGLANLGLLYNSMGRYAAAEQLTQNALDVRKQYRGVQSMDYGASLNNMAVLNKDLGNYNQAEKEISEAVALNLAVLGDESIAYAISLNNRGVLYQTLGRYDDAEKDIVKGLEVAAKTLKSYSLQYTRLQSNLALLYQQQGKYAEAEAIFDEAISAIAKNPTKSKKSNPDYAHMIENLASLYQEMGQDSKAEPLYIEALNVYEKKFGADYSGYGLTSARLGSLYLKLGKLNEAEGQLAKAERIMVESFGEQHPYTVDLWIQLGVMNWRNSKITEADMNFTKGLDKSLEFVGKYFAPMSDTEKALYWKTLQPRFEKYYAFAASQDNPVITRRALQYRLATKAMLLSSSTKVKSQILQSGDSSLIKDYLKWLDTKGSLAHYFAMSQEDLTEQKVNLDSINRAANSLEKSLSERSNLFSAAYANNIPSVSDVQAKLSNDEKAVEIIRVEEENNEVEYLVIVISPTELYKTTLKNGQDLDGIYFKRYRNLMRFKKDDDYSYNDYWLPIDNLLSGAGRVFVSPDGIYNQISISSLRLPDGSFNLDSKTYISISSLRDLININPNENPKSKTAVLFGDPLYGSDKINQLPATRKEVSAINDVLKAAKFSTTLAVGSEATETKFLANANKSIIHVATHGFFVPDTKKTQSSVFSIPLYNVKEDVLLRSGILLANAGEDQNDRIVAGDNGVLTSYEVLRLNLDGTSLVVLSACETGLGDLMSGEGVYGLQRAFMVAGASNVIMSLWKVDDEATQELMVSFYKNWLQSNDMIGSFTKAQKQVRAKYNHPYYWGSFVLLRN